LFTCHAHVIFRQPLLAVLDFELQQWFRAILNFSVSSVMPATYFRYPMAFYLYLVLLVIFVLCT
jgi:hypothetical protein